ncbi:MAG: lipoprotein-releasing ABC transporter permease subunit [Pseudomonadales bacterium]|nr:lipoprotein-releasing ABC transporter permease subunit [Pseudomonadales bacterium]
MTQLQSQQGITSSLPFSALVAFRYVTFRQRGPGSSFLTWVSLLGLMLSVATLIIVISVMNGFQTELQKRLLSLIPDAKLYLNDKDRAGINQHSSIQWQELRDDILTQDGILTAAPFIEQTAMVNTDGRFQVVDLLAVDYTLEAELTGINDYIIAGDASALKEQKYGIVIGRLLARQLGLTVGDSLQLVLPKVAISPAGVVMREKRFTVSAIFEVGAEADQNLVLISLLTGQKLMARGASVDGLKLELVDRFNIKNKLDNALFQLVQAKPKYQSLSALDWRNDQRSLFTAIAMEKIIIFVLLLAVVGVAAFNIVSIVLMSVMDKYSDIAVLKTMGANTTEIRNIFLLQGLLIASIGTAFGTLLGLLIAPNAGFIVSSIEHLFNWQLFDPSVFYISHLPSEIRFLEIFITILSALLISLLASVYPAQKAASIPPAAALSYEI